MWGLRLAEGLVELWRSALVRKEERRAFEMGNRVPEEKLRRDSDSRSLMIRWKVLDLDCLQIFRTRSTPHRGSRA